MTEEEFAAYLIEDMQKAECSPGMIRPINEDGHTYINSTIDMRAVAALMLERLRVDAISVLPNGRHMLRINDSWFDGPEVAL